MSQTREEREAEVVADFAGIGRWGGQAMRRHIVILGFLACLLGACSEEAVTRSIGAGMTSWCRNAPNHCTVSDASP